MKPSLILLVLASFQAQVKEEDVKKAEAVLTNTPDDPAANLTVGKALAFNKEDWEAAIPHFGKGSDATLKGLAEKEMANPKTGPERVGLGDDWFEATKKFPTFRKSILDRSVFWYAKAWPDLEGPWKDKMRARFQKIFQTPGFPPPKSAVAPKDWTVPPTAKVGQSMTAAHTGKMSLQLVPTKDRQAVFGQSVILKPGTTYELSGWILTDGTDSADDSLYAPGYSADGNLVLHPMTVVFPDQPWWKRISTKFTAPANAAKMTVGFALNSTKGTIFLDDISLMGDGKELLKNGSFEEK